MQRQKNKVNNGKYNTIFETPSTRNVPTFNSPTLHKLPDEFEDFSKHFNLKLKPFLQYTSSLLKGIPMLYKVISKGIPKIYKGNIVIYCLKTDVTSLSIKSISKTMLYLDNIELYQIITNDIPLVIPCIKDVTTCLQTYTKRRRYGY